jgi:hypothetical protein
MSTTIAHQGSLKFSRLQSSAGLTNTKIKVNKRRSYLGFTELSFIWVPGLHESKRKNKDDTTTTATPLLSHLESREQPTKGRAMPEILRPGMPRSRGHPPDLPSGPRYARTHAAPARALTLGNVIRRQPTPIGYPADPVGSRSINTVLDQVHRQGQRRCQGRHPVNLF